MACRGIPMEEVPSDAEPITEEQFERLPTYVHEYMADSLAGKLPQISHRELEEIHAKYMTPRIQELMEPDEEAVAGEKRPVESISNSPPDNLEYDGAHEV